MCRHADEATVRRWFDAFNSRDLEEMLACMDPDVDFRPLQLHGIEGAYRCHDGVRDWLADLMRMKHHHRIELSRVKGSSGGEVIAAGTLFAASSGGSSSFWAVERFEGGLIVAASHSLSDRFHLR
jgi:ketosteroid isomerase-like protein